MVYVLDWCVFCYRINYVISWVWSYNLWVLCNLHESPMGSIYAPSAWRPMPLCSAMLQRLIMYHYVFLLDVFLHICPTALHMHRSAPQPGTSPLHHYTRRPLISDHNIYAQRNNYNYTESHFVPSPSFPWIPRASTRTGSSKAAISVQQLADDLSHSVRWPQNPGSSRPFDANRRQLRVRYELQLGIVIC